MWSLGHFIMIVSPFILAILFYLLTKNKSLDFKRYFGIIISSVCIILLILRNLEILFQYKKIEPEIIPFQICHFANFVLLFAFLFRSKTLQIIAFCFNLPFAYLSILFANSLENYTTLLSLRAIAYIWGHILIVAVTLWAVCANVIRTDKKAYKYGIILILLMFIISIPINNLFMKLMPGKTSKYFYSYLPESGTPLEIAYNFGKNINFLGMTVNPIYIFFIALFGILMFISLYGVLKLLKK